jgi:integrase/recombinase XerD
MTRAYLEPDDVNKLERAATCLRDRLLIRVLFHLGCRISEALALEVKDIDFSCGTLTIEHLKARIRLSCPGCGARLGKAHAFCPKCGIKVERALAEEREHRRVRTLPVDKDTLQILREYIKRGGPVSRSGRHLIFGIRRHRAWQVVKECAEKAELPKLINPETGKSHNVSPHRLRDAFAVHAVKTAWRTLRLGHPLQQPESRRLVRTLPLFSELPSVAAQRSHSPREDRPTHAGWTCPRFSARSLLEVRFLAYPSHSSTL